MNATARFRIILIALLLSMLLAACRRAQDTGPTPIPTSSPTPVSTALPLVPTTIPPGAQENPLRMVILPYDPEQASALESDFEAALETQASAAIDVVLVNRYAEALAALCDSGRGTVSSAWLDGLTYMGAISQSCGSPVLQVERDGETGGSGQIVIRRALGTSSMSALRGRTFCRLGFGDFYSWILPTLIFKANNIDTETYFKEVVDYKDQDSLLEAVANGDCDGTGIAQTALDPILQNNDTISGGVRVVETSIPVPYSIYMVPLEVPLGVRLSLLPALLKMSEDPDLGPMMQAFLGQDALVTAAPDDFSDFEDFMHSTGLDFSQLGN